MNIIFLWFYRLDISDALLLIVLATLVFLAFRVKFRAWKHWNSAMAVCLVCWLCVILLGTLGNRSGGAVTAEPVLIPFRSYYLASHGGSRELYRTNFMNAVLFYPAGLLALEVLPKRLRKRIKTILALTFFLALSIGIEYCQYRFSLGLVEIDDVIHNILGAFLGILVSLPEWEIHWQKIRSRFS